MTTIAQYSKLSSEVLDYVIDWSSALSSETISTSTWAAAPSDITISTSSNTTTTATVWLSGGTSGLTYTLTNTITTSSNRTLARTITVYVGPRAGMVNLISRLRGLTNAGTADYSIAGVTYWNDGQMLEYLDQTMQQYKMLMLVEKPGYQGGSAVWYDYEIPRSIGRNYEEYSATDLNFVVRDNVGSAVGTANYSVNYLAGLVRFTTDQAGADYYVDVRTFNVYEAAAQIWEAKAGHVSGNVDWQSDNHQVKASQEAEHCLKMAQKLRNMGGGIKVSTMFRVDEY